MSRGRCLRAWAVSEEGDFDATPADPKPPAPRTPPTPPTPDSKDEAEKLTTRPRWKFTKYEN